MTGRPLELRRVGDFVVARLTGDIDLRNVTSISSDISDAVGNNSLGLVVDLEATRYIDSVGVHMLFTLIRRLEASRQGMALLIAEESPIRNLVKITNLDEVVDVRPTLEECLTVLEARAGDAY